jgi:hypothetical protein
MPGARGIARGPERHANRLQSLVFQVHRTCVFENLLNLIENATEFGKTEIIVSLPLPSAVGDGNFQEKW